MPNMPMQPLKNNWWTRGKTQPLWNRHGIGPNRRSVMKKDGRQRWLFINRVWFSAGSKKLPNNLWFSVSGDLYNFELGSSYDADAIDFGLLSDGANKICGLFSGRHLQVFTSQSEWMVSGDPLTPGSIHLNAKPKSVR